MATFGRTMRSAAGGLGAVAAALVNGRAAEQSGFEQEQERETKLAQALAQVRSLDASAKLNGAQAAKVGEETAVLQRQQGISDEAMAAFAGVDLPTFNAGRTELRTGQAPMVPMGPEAEDGSMGVGTAKFSPETRSRISQVLVRLAPVLNTQKDLNPEQYAKALGLFANQDEEAAVNAGRMTPMQLAQQRYAAKGGAPFQFDSSGLVGNNLTGGLNESSTRAQSVTGKEMALGKQATAGAAENYAQAGAAKELANKYKAETTAVGQTPKADFKDTTSIRKEFEDRAEVKNFRQAMPVLEAARNAPDTPQGDLQLIYGVGKVLDPNSVVREGEMSLVIKSGTPTDRLEGFVNYLQGGGRLSPKARQRLVKALESRTQEYQRDYDTVRKSYDGLAQRRGLDSAEVFMNDRTPQPASPPAAAAPSGTGPYSDAEKERRYQAWKASQEGKK